MALVLVTPPVPVVTWAEARLQLPGAVDTDQTLVEALIDAATATIDGPTGWLGRAIKSQVWDLVYDEFPAGGIQLPLAPLISVDSVNYVDPDTESETVLSDELYSVDTISEPGWVIVSESWPDVMDTPNSVRIQFTAGYATVPAPIKQAIILMTKQMFASAKTNTALASETVEGIGSRRWADASANVAVTDKAVASLLSGYRIWSL